MLKYLETHGFPFWTIFRELLGTPKPEIQMYNNAELYPEMHHLELFLLKVKVVIVRSKIGTLMTY